MRKPFHINLLLVPQNTVMEFDWYVATAIRVYSPQNSVQFWLVNICQFRRPFRFIQQAGRWPA